MRADEVERKLIDTLGRRRRGANLAEQARERRSGEIPIQVSASGPGRAKPKGATSARCAKHTPFARNSWKGQSPGTAARRAGPCTSVRGYTGEWNGRWVLPDGNGRIPFERRRLRRVNPMSAAGTKQDRHGSKGVTRQEGNQTLKTERGGQAKARVKRTFETSSAVGTKSPWEELIRCGGPARCGWVRLSGRPSSTSGFHCTA